MSNQPKRQSIDDLFPDEDLEITPVPVKQKRNKATEQEETKPQLKLVENSEPAEETEPKQEPTPAEPAQENAEPGMELEKIIEEEEKQRQQSRLKKPFNVQDGLTIGQWAAVEAYYTDAANQIVIPEEPTSAVVLKIVSDIDRLFTEARFDQAHVARVLKRYKAKLDNAKKTVYKQIKDIAKNDKERDAEGIAWLESNPLQGDPMSIFEMVDVYTDRDEYMDAVISILKQKGDKLIIVASALKMELSLIR